jgi:hypothetical protein
MTTDPEKSIVPPSQTSGGNAPDADEVARKGDWAGHAADGIVPAEQGGSDAPREMLAPDPELGSSVLGQTTGSDEPATESGVDSSAGDDAEATASAGANLPHGEGVERSVRDAAMNPMQAVHDYHKTKAVR